MISSRRSIFTLISLVIISLSLTACKPKVTIENKNLQTTQTQSSQANQDVNFKASFAVFTNSTFRIFTASMYHNQSEDVFITAENPNIVNGKKSSITWGDFFNSLPMQLTSDCLVTGTGEKFCNSSVKTLKFYVNGQKVDDFLARVIKPGDRALISYGAESDDQIQDQLNQVPTL